MLTTASPIDQLLSKAKQLTPVPAAIVNPYDDLALKSALAAEAQGFITPVFVGDKNAIGAATKQAGMPLRGHIVDCEYDEAAPASARLALSGRVKMLVKGAIHSDALLHAILEQPGLRTHRLSHIVVTERPAGAGLMLLTDGAVNVFPTLSAKAEIVQNAIDVARKLGIAVPKVAILAAVETIAASMAATIDAAALSQMAERGQISGGIVDGPLALDDAVSPEAAAAKGIASNVAGHADILLSPDLEAGNILYKAFDVLLGARFGAVIAGAAIPIVLTSRADSVEARVTSCALARLLIEE